jgi:hypothetical protein
MILASSSVSAASADWIAILIAVLAMFGSVLATIIASRSARADKRFEIQVNRLNEIQSRNSERKYEMYKPVIELFGQALSIGEPSPLTDDERKKVFLDFTTWVSIYGSDGMMTAYHNLRQAIFMQMASINAPADDSPPKNDVPAAILARLYVDFILAIRRDIGYPDTKIGVREILGIRVDDLYSVDSMILTLPFEKLCEREKWTPPWTDRKLDRSVVETAQADAASPPPS